MFLTHLMSSLYLDMSKCKMAICFKYMEKCYSFVHFLYFFVLLSSLTVILIFICLFFHNYVRYFPHKITFLFPFLLSFFHIYATFFHIFFFSFVFKLYLYSKCPILRVFLFSFLHFDIFNVKIKYRAILHNLIFTQFSKQKKKFKRKD